MGRRGSGAHGHPHSLAAPHSPAAPKHNSHSPHSRPHSPGAPKQNSQGRAKKEHESPTSPAAHGHHESHPKFTDTGLCLADLERGHATAELKKRYSKYNQSLPKETFSKGSRPAFPPGEDPAPRLPHRGTAWHAESGVRALLCDALEEHSSLCSGWQGFRDLLTKIAACHGEPLPQGPGGECLLSEGLQSFFKTCSAEESKRFFHDTLPFVLAQAVEVESFPDPAAMHSGTRATGEVSRSHACSLLACAFLWVMPPGADMECYPEFSFRRFFVHLEDNKAQHAKMRCFLRYFECYRQRLQCGTSNRPPLEIERIMGEPKDSVWWRSQETPLGELCVQDAHEDATASQIADTAVLNMSGPFVGGQVLGAGVRVDEVAFAESPELCVAMLIAEALEPNEVLALRNAEHFTTTKGSLSSLSFAGNARQRNTSEVLVMRKLDVRQDDQDGPAQLGNTHFYCVQSLNAWHAAFSCTKQGTVCVDWQRTGPESENQLRSLLQWMAASVAGKRLAYRSSSLPDKSLEQLRALAAVLCDQGASVRDLWTAIHHYQSEDIRPEATINPKMLSEPAPFLYDFVLEDLPPRKKQREARRSLTNELLYKAAGAGDQEVQAAAPPCNQADDDYEAKLSRLHGEFLKWDVDGSGAIDLEELTSLFQVLDPSLPAEAIKQLFINADSNLDGAIDYQEFVSWLYS
eukprot:gnl/TRDRNA2_/TRDRNA2_93983_c0_seq2.p1 gnl/TRDRNA2_/TRDRNA2_93983_c0~~gnl/TRDRNA2_/TRDRNA2_93983_c0_seq2.p1  ORF type:complete len:689 (-),score=110.31 gnl/TRDRNA2_/TRDRNA2_93983_c0_seq2:129-2195(-)